MSVSLGGSLQHCLPGDISQAIGNVLLNCTGKQHRLLTYKSHLQTHNKE